ncbi:BTAD domain-containing putative transcriptional regulator [Roseovarius aestuarii]|uniref:Transcriptional regulatory protein MoaR1 n=1 Tax=Roseovarius aestuarii TaxID=475083 RepID=A0A1X7BXR5_9RHOB|nr:BTAD domain-containing putative transcriptional regulator [Roseovarius aestuarii]SMC14447.1 Transcriptional regulatory protein MoaR1 [Roseovarius aestuarii]
MNSRSDYGSNTLLRLEMLGPLRVEVEGESLSLSAKKGLALLVYLGLRAETNVPRETVCGLLWGDSREAQAKASLRQALTTLRKYLGAASSAIGADRDRLSFNRSLVQSDVTDFLKLAGLGTENALEEAAELYRGDLLEGFGQVTPEFDCWLDGERSALRARYFTVLTKLCDAYETQGRQEDVITAASLVLRLNPLCEDMHRKLMKSYLAQNRTDAALKQFSSLKDTLDRELNVSPEPETQDLMRKVRSSRSRRSEPELEPNLKPRSQATKHVKKTQHDGKPSIAVLPFQNMSFDPEQEYFCDGVSEDIITELSRFSSLFVVARNSSFTFKGRTFKHQDVAQELGVRYMLEGSIRRAGDRIRVTAQLIECAAGSHIWAERYEKTLDDIFELQDDITRSVVGAIAPQIEQAEIARVFHKREIEFSSYDLALKAKALFHNGAYADTDGQDAVVELAEQALELDPRNTDAIWIQAFSYVIRHLYQLDDNPGPLLDRADAAAESLFKSDRPEPGAFSVRGMIRHFKGEFDSATADFRRAFDLNPNFALNIFFMAWHESLVGRMKEAKEHAQFALRLSPRDSDYWVGDAFLSLAQACFAESRFEEVQNWGARAIQYSARAPIRRALMIASATHLGQPEDARPHADALASFAPKFLDSIVSGRLILYRLPEHNALLVSGIKKSGYLS